MPTCVQPVEFRTLFGGYTAAMGNPGYVFPQMVLLDTIKFTVAYALVGVQLSTSIVNLGASIAGVYIVIGQDKPNLSVSDSIGAPICEFSSLNSIAGPPIIPIPTTKSGSAPFGGYAVPLQPGTPISLYGFADSTAGNFVYGMAQLYLARAKIR